MGADRNQWQFPKNVGGKVIGWRDDGKGMENKTVPLIGLSLASEIRDFLDTPPYVATRTALKALDTTEDTTAILTENGRDGVFIWKTGDYSALVAADTQEGVVVKADAVAATSGAWVRRYDDAIRPEWFGAVQDFNGTTGTDSAPAMSAMIAVAKILKVPMSLKSGNGYYCASGLSATNMSFTMRGDNFGSSSFIFDNAGDGLVITQDDYLHSTSLEGFSIFTLQQEPGVGLKITYSSSDSINNRNVPRCRVIDVECRGYNILSDGWAKGMLFTDTHRPSIVRPCVTGRRNIADGGIAQFTKMTSGIEIVGTYPPTFTAIPSDINIDSPRIDHAINSIKGTGEVEGLIVNSPVFVGVDTGVICDYSTARPMVKIAGGHMNVFSFGVNLTNAPQSTISDLLIYKYQDAENDTVAVSLDGCDDSSVKNLTLVNQASNAATDGEWNGVVVTNSARCTIDDIRHPSPSKTVILLGTTTLTRTSGLKPDGTYTNATVQTYDDSSSGTNEYSGGNKPIANVTNASNVAITSTPGAAATFGPINVNKGERYLVEGFINATKGPTAGEFLTQLAKTGTATAVFGANRSSLLERSAQAVTATVAHSVSGILTVTASGTLTFQLIGTSTGSNSDVLAGDAQLSITLL